MNDGFMFGLKVAWRALRLFAAIALFAWVLAHVVSFSWVTIGESLKPVTPYVEEVKIWLPAKYTLVNRNADGSYAHIERFGLKGIAVPHEAYRLLADRGHSTVVVAGDTVTYYITIDKSTFVSVHEAKPTPRKGELAEVRSVTLVSDGVMVFSMGKDDSGMLSSIFWIIILGGVISLVAYWFAKRIAPPHPFLRSGWTRPVAV